MVGLLTGDPSKIAVPSQGVDNWGSTFVTDDQVILALKIAEGSLTPEENGNLKTWDEQTSWMDRAAGRKLSLQEKASLLTELTSTAGMAILGGAKGIGSGARFADKSKLDDHFARHGSDFGAKNALEYQAQADKFLTASKPAGVLEKTRANGDIVRYNPGTDEFGVVSSGGSIRTYYKPDPAVHGKGSNLDYFNAQ